MFDFIRKHTKITMGLLFLLIVPSFILFGLDGYSQSKDKSPSVARVDGQAILQTDWDKAHLREVDRIKASEALIDYVYRLVQHSRHSGEFGFGLSPRGSLALLRAAKAWALLQERPHVLPEDVQAVLPAVVEHRLRGNAETGGRDGETLARRLLTQVDVIN